MNVTRQTLNKPKAWLFPQKTFIEHSAGEGEIFRVFNCDLPVQEKNGILFNQKPRATPHLLPPVEVFREGETDVVQMALQFTRESGISSCTDHPDVARVSLLGNAWSCWMTAQSPPGRTLRVESSMPLKHSRG